MRLRGVLPITLPLLLLASALPALAQDANEETPLDRARRVARDVEGSVVSSLAKVRRSSVSVLNQAEVKDADGKGTGEYRLASGGSGVLIKHRAKTWVLTNQHVVEGADALAIVGVDGVERAVSVQDAVPQYDIALLRFHEKPKGLSPVTLKKQASQQLGAGDLVLATGNPFFLAVDGAPVATLGVVSGTDRVLGGRFLYGAAIQHDAAVNPGNSGGPLWDLDGRLVGINGMIMTTQSGRAGASNSGASFSIPIAQVVPHLSTLVDGKKSAEAGYLGVRFQTHQDRDGNPDGAEVLRVMDDSPVRSGRKHLLSGNVIRELTVGSKIYKIRTADDLTNALVLYPAGTSVRLRWSSRLQKKLQTWNGRLGKQPVAKKK
jgi:S1-C subfamily serine protease